MWNCVCDCGAHKTVTANSLRKGVSKSCGCYSTEVKSVRTAERNRRAAARNGASKEPLFHVWNAIRHRCYFETDEFYPIYGGRGISMCSEWKESYLGFKEWALNSGWRHGLSIDRIDNNGPYSPKNCRWATAKEQANNRRSNRLFSAYGETLNIKQWSERFGVPYNKLRYRLVQKGLTVPNALKELDTEVIMA